MNFDKFYKMKSNSYKSEDIQIHIVHTFKNLNKKIRNEKSTMSSAEKKITFLRKKA